MKSYKKSPCFKQIVAEVQCNRCGKFLSVEQNLYFEGKYEWGYGSVYDEEHHEFDLCEPCYTAMIQSFKIPITNSYSGK